MFGIETGSGVWNALILILFLIITIIIAYLFRRLGVKGHKKRDYVGEPFYFGNEIPESAYVKASNVYWGFIKTMEKYYKPVIGEHTGNVNDYMAWLVLTMAGILLVIFFM